jgi:GNAT superfamily N-acetyltransferase
MRETQSSVTLLDEADTEALESVLIDRLYEFNSEATGHFDGQLIGGSVRADDGELIGGFSGHTWAACCEIAHLWVSLKHRGKGLGGMLLRAAETEASRRGCTRLMLYSYSFQAPDFYAARGYERQFAVADWPNGHSNFCYIKPLSATAQERSESSSDNHT